MRATPRFTATLPVLLREQTEWVKIPPKLMPFIKEGEGAVRQGGYLVVTLPPFGNPAVPRLRAKLKRQRVAFRETEAGGWVTFSTAPELPLPPVNNPANNACP